MGLTTPAKWFLAAEAESLRHLPPRPVGCRQAQVTQVVTREFLKRLNFPHLTRHRLFYVRSGFVLNAGKFVCDYRFVAAKPSRGEPIPLGRLGLYGGVH